MPSPPPDIPTVKGATGKFAVFQRMRLKMSLLHLPSICYLTVTENPRVFIESGLAPFDKCTVYIGDTLAATMYAVAVEPHLDKSGHQVSLALAAPTIDAVECSIDTDTLKTWAITSGTVGSVAMQILKPYNISVKSIQDVALNTAYPIPVQSGRFRGHPSHHCGRADCLGTHVDWHDRSRGADGGLLIMATDTLNLDPANVTAPPPTPSRGAPPPPDTEELVIVTGGQRTVGLADKPLI
jgi:hypothetical protein